MRFLWIILLFFPLISFAGGIKYDSYAGVQSLTDIGDLGCNNNEIIKWNDSSEYWACSVDTGGASSNSFTTIGVAVADTSTDTLTINDSISIDFTSGDDPETLTASFAYTATLATNPALSTDQCVFSVDGAGGGILCEGSTAGGEATVEGLLVWNPGTADRTLTLPNEDGTICSTGSICTGYSSSSHSHTLVGDVDGDVGTTDLDEAAVEIELEAVLDLADLQTKVLDNLTDVVISAPAAGHVLVRNAGNTDFANVAISQDATITATGVLEVTQADALEVDGSNCSNGDGAIGIDTVGAAQCDTNIVYDDEANTFTADQNIAAQGDVCFQDSTGGDKYCIQSEATAPSGTTTLTLNVDVATCSGDGNGGALTINGSNEIVCSADAGGAGGSLTVEDIDDNPTVGSVTVIQFDAADGIVITDETAGQVQIDLVNIPDSVLATSYSGTGSCTNQFVRGLNDATTPTCNTIALTTDTSGDYVLAISDGTGIDVTGSQGEGWTATVNLIYTSTLAGNPALNVDECVFSTDGTGGGILCEGSVTAGEATIEGLLVWSPTTADRTLTLPDATDTLVGKDTTDILTNKTITAASNAVEADDLICTDCIGSTEISDLTLNTHTSGSYVEQVADGTGIDGTVNSEAGTYTPTLDLTEISSLTFGAGSFTTMVFDVATSDPTLTISANTITISSSGGTSPVLALDDAGATRWLEEDSGGSNYKAFVSPSTLTADTTCTFEDDANFIPDSCVGDGSDDDVPESGDFTNLTGGSGVDNNSGTLDLDFTEISSLTWGAGSFTTITYDAGATDPVLRFSSPATIQVEGGGTSPLLNIDDQGELRLVEEDAGGTDYIGFRAPSAITSSVTCTLENDSSPIPDSCVGDGSDAGGSGSPGGQTTEAQFNNGGAFEGADKLTFASSTAGAAFGAGSTTAGTWPTLASGTVLTTAVDGTIEEDADAFYLTTDAGNRGIVDVQHCIRQDASRTLPNDTNENAIFNSITNGRITLETGTYFFNGMLLVTGMSATSGNALIDILGAGTATAGTWLWNVCGLDNTTTTTVADDDCANRTTQDSAASAVAAGTGTGMRVYWEGTMEITAGGTLIPSIDQVTAAAATLAAGSYFCIQRIGSTTMTGIGQWD